MTKPILGARVAPMFEVGQDYRIHWLDGGNDTYSTFKVEAWEAPLLKVSQGEDVTIFNTASSTFLKASPARPYNLDYV